MKFLSQAWIALATLMLGISVPVAAETLLTPLPPTLVAAKPIPLLPTPIDSSFVFSDTANRSNPGRFARIDDIDGLQRFRAVNTRGSINQAAVNARWLNAVPIRKGDVLFARFYARAVVAKQESGEAEGFFFVQSKTPGSDREFAQAWSVGPEWTLINAPFVASRDMPAGNAELMLAFGNLEQTVEFAGFDVVNFADRLAFAALPQTKFTYAGREANAAWRKAALARIEKLRTAPFTVRVVDRNGAPVANARVDVAMVRSAFLWGSSVSAERLTDKDADADKYRRTVIDLFDLTVIENGFKWPRWIEPDYQARALTSLDWLIESGKRVKGHNLAWPAWKFTPRLIADDPAKRANIAALSDAHIRDLTAKVDGRVIGWDVVNEPVHEADYFKYMPREHVAEWFKIAEAADPKAQLTLNEYGMLNRSSSPLMIADMLAFARMLKANGARVDVLGVQGHVGQTPRPPVAVLSDLDLLAVDGHQIQITEFDFNTRDEALQADYTRDFLIALYSHPATTGFIMWGFWEPEHWKPAAAMFNPDWSGKPNLKVWQDLVRGAWRTKLSLTTAAGGTASGSGHLGTYDVNAAAGGRSGTARFVLTPGASEVVITLK